MSQNFENPYKALEEIIIHCSNKLEKTEKRPPSAKSMESCINAYIFGYLFLSTIKKS